MNHNLCFQWLTEGCLILLTCYKVYSALILSLLFRTHQLLLSLGLISSTGSFSSKEFQHLPIPFYYSLLMTQLIPSQALFSHRWAMGEASGSWPRKICGGAVLQAEEAALAKILIQTQKDVSCSQGRQSKARTEESTDEVRKTTKVGSCRASKAIIKTL